MNPKFEDQMTGEEATAKGYRRISNKYHLVARIDRPDWITVLAKELHRAPADFYVPGDPSPSGNWCDYYRRGSTKDKIELPLEEFMKVPGSGWDNCGYVAIDEPSVATKPQGPIKCECGAEKCGSKVHSGWCPKGTK